MPSGARSRDDITHSAAGGGGEEGEGRGGSTEHGLTGLTGRETWQRGVV